MYIASIWSSESVLYV